MLSEHRPFRAASVIAPLIVACTGIVACGEAPEVTSAAEFYYAVAKGDIDRARYFLSSKRANDPTMASALAKEAERVQKCGMRNIQASTKNVTKSFREVQVIMNFQRCGAEIEKVKLIEENGKWVIVVD